jgi:hypothetical protein
VLCILFFLIAAIGSISVMSVAIGEGDLDRLRYGISSNSTLCNAGSEGSRSKLVFCFSPTTDLVFRVCANSCPKSGDDLIDIYNDKKDEFVFYGGLSESAWETSSHLAVKTFCIAPSVSVINRCIYDFTIANVTASDIFYTANATDPAGKALASASQMFLNAYSDVSTAWYVIAVCGVAGGLVVSFIWLQLLRCLAGPIVWGSVMLFFGGLIAMSVLLAGKAGMTGGEEVGNNTPPGEGTETAPQTELEDEYQIYYKYLFWIFIGITGAAMLVLLFLFHRIQLAIALVKEAADVLKAIPQLILTPIIPSIVVGLLVMYGTFIMALLASSGTIEEGELKWDRDLRYSMLYHVGFTLWMLFFVGGLHTVVMAGAVSSYYWLRDKNELSSPITKSMHRTLRYSVGSVLFGSFILAAIKIIKWVLNYVSQKIKKHAGNDNYLIKFVLCCFNCCLWCFEKFVKFLTKNAYIMIAVDGSSFCGAAKSAWSIIMSNILRMTAVNVISAYVFFISKVSVGFLCGLGATIWLEKFWVYVEDDAVVSSPFAPSICTFILAFFVAFLFFEVVDFTIDTLLFCFCLDDMKNSQTGDYYASKRLVTFMSSAPKMENPY